MKQEKSKIVINTIIGVAAAALLIGGIYAMCGSKTPVGIINFEAVQKKAKVYLHVAEQKNKFDEKVQAKVLKDKDFIQLQEEGKKLSEQQKTMPAAEFDRKSQALQMRAIRIQERYRSSFERSAVASQLAMKSIEKEIAEAIEATAKKTGAKVLLPVNTILYASEKADFTDVFVDELDKRVETVEFPDPEKLQ